jgi:hypothetical protein
VLKDPADIQKFGSAISYMKRYAYAAICGIAAGESDDDGSMATQPASYRAANTDQPQFAESLSKNEFISPKQFGLLKGKIKESGRPERETEICKKYGIPSLDKLPWKKMNEVLESLISNHQQASTDPQFTEVFDIPF